MTDADTDSADPGFAPGRLVEGRWQLDDKMGKGGQGEMWRAVDRETGEAVAIKALALQETDDWTSIELFERAAEVLERIDHPQIPRYLDAFHRQESETGLIRYGLVREFVEGRDLETRLDEQGAMDWENARILMEEMAELLEYLHGQQPPIVHRDIKPANIVSRSDGTIALVDFGASQQAWEMSLGGTKSVGTIGYTPPEQLAGSGGPASDLYALGATVVHLMTRTEPSELPADRLRLQFRDRVDAPEPFCELLDDLLDPDPETRLGSARELRNRLQALDDRAADGGERPAATDLEATETVDRPELLERGERYVRFRLPGRSLGARLLTRAPLWVAALIAAWAIGSTPAAVASALYGLVVSIGAALDDKPLAAQLSDDGLRIEREAETAGTTFNRKGTGWRWGADDVDASLTDADPTGPGPLARMLAVVAPTWSVDTFVAYLESYDLDRDWLAAEWTRIQRW